MRTTSKAPELATGNRGSAEQGAGGWPASDSPPGVELQGSTVLVDLVDDLVVLGDDGDAGPIMGVDVCMTGAYVNELSRQQNTKHPHIASGASTKLPGRDAVKMRLTAKVHPSKLWKRSLG